MTGKTHLAVGMAASLLITQPDNIRELVLCLGTAPIGSVISDIDVSTSGARRKINKIITITFLAILIAALIEYRWKIGIITSFMNNSSLLRLMIGLGAFIGICVFGKNCPHRSFMHSFAAAGILSGILYIIFPAIVPYFAVSMLSHIAADILNYTNVRLLYPLNWGISLNICHANGYLSRLLCLLGSIIIIIYILIFLWQTGFTMSHL